MSLGKLLKEKLSELKDVLKDEKFYTDLKDESKKEFDSLKNELLTLVEEYSNKFNRNRGFEIVSDSFRKFPNQEIQMPTRGSEHSAGYDFYSNETVDISIGGKYLFWTDIKAYMNVDEVLEIYPRSSIGIKKDLALANTTGIIDMDYYQNPDNDGIIGVCLRNLSTNIVKIEKGERIAQGIFLNYKVADNGNSSEKRKGGIGSTNK